MPKHTNEKLVSASFYAAVTPSDTVNLTVNGEERECRAIYVGTTGNVIAIRPDDGTVTFANVPAGAIIPIVCKRIGASTTASNMVALF